MRKGLALVVTAALCVAPAALGHTQETSPATGQATAPAGKTTAKAAAPAASGRIDAAEARYRAWVDREHAQDAAVFQTEKSKVEDKYKGYVRPPHEKKGTKTQKASEKSSD